MLPRSATNSSVLRKARSASGVAAHAASAGVAAASRPRRDAQRRRPCTRAGDRARAACSRPRRARAARPAARRTRPRRPRASSNRARRRRATGTPLKKLTLGTTSRRSEAVLGQRHREPVARVRMVTVDGAVAVLRRVAEPVRRAAQRVVAPAGVGDDRQEHAAHVGEQQRARAEVGLPLHLHRVGDVQALAAAVRRCTRARWRRRRRRGR